ncbi:MAG: DUF488 domain-containing protein [Gammaproteobacteria bacterium]|jgi:uncharacterized protein (DUF488 family)|nr:DUF488 domain-containing protein [Gammaproteobacteria bacterium]
MIQHSSTTLYTFGHSNRTIQDFIRALQSAAIATLVDVRANPQSQRYPQFSQPALRQSLEAAGITYHWAGKSLGGRRQGWGESQHVAIADENMRAYADYMESDVFQKAAMQLMNLAASANTAILCAEKLPEHCHRSLISDYLLLQGFEVQHILDQDTINSHQLSPLARRESQQLIYDCGVTRSLDL